MTYDDIVALKLVWVGFETFWTKPFAIDESSIGAFDVFNKYLGKCEVESRAKYWPYFVPFLPDFCMLSTEDFRVEIAVSFAWSGFRIGLTANFDMLIV